MKMGVTAALTRPIKLPPFGDAVATALVIQGVIFVLTAMMLDGGLTNRLASFSLLFYWASFSGVLLVRVIRRHFTFTRVDAGIVKFSYFAYLLMLPFLDLLAAWLKDTH
ncbi:MAG: hypothetical protein WC708_20135 [Lentisphaeria bacterium]